MATRKKIITKKSVKPTVKRSVASKSKGSNFWKIKFTINTIYWLIIGVAVISVALLLYSTNLQVDNIYDQIDQVNNSVSTSPTVNKSTR